MDKETEDTVRRILKDEIIVYYTKNDELNYKRDEAKRKLIDWIVEQIGLESYASGCRYEVPDYAGIFGTSVWTAIRRALIAIHPICEICGVNKTKEIHHIRPRFLQGTDHPRNLMCLCMECHDVIHSQLDAEIENAIAMSRSATEWMMTGVLANKRICRNCHYFKDDHCDFHDAITLKDETCGSYMPNNQKVI